MCTHTINIVNNRLKRLSNVSTRNGGPRSGNMFRSFPRPRSKMFPGGTVILVPVHSREYG